MYKIIRFWNQNRKKIIIIISIIVFLIIVIQLLDYMSFTQKQNLEKNEEKNNQSEQLPVNSIITGETIDAEITKENTDIIKQFVEYCNQKDTVNAYNLLSEECKKTLFANEEEFIQYYYNIIFTEKKMITIKNYRNSLNYYTYLVEFYNDVLTDGKITDNDIYKDYITINKENNKININSFIYSTTLNKSNEYKGIEIEVQEQQIYKEYEKYVISVKNTTNKKILLDTRTMNRSIYVIGNNTRYSAFANEILDSMYEIPAYYTKTYTIKFDKIYNPEIISREIVFSDIVSDFENYIEKPENEKNRIKIVIEL